MAVTVLKPTVIVDGALAALERAVVLPRLVTVNGGADFVGAYNDTVTYRVPAYTTARSRTMRAGTSRTSDDLAECAVDVKLDTNVYKQVKISDEELTLDIRDFAAQVINPCAGAVARKVEDLLATEITNGSYDLTQDFDPDDPFGSIVDARSQLNLSNVPLSQRTLAVGSSIEAAILKSEQFARYQNSGDNTALRDAAIGRIAGTEVVAVPALDPDKAYLFHKTAFVLITRAPQVPQGAAWGSTASSGGLSMRVIQFLDVTEDPVDVIAFDAWMGAELVTDKGSLDGDGRFEPAEDPEDSGAEDLVIRAVELTLSSS